MAHMPKNIPEYIAVSPMTLACPKCKAAPGIPCDVVNEFELIHLERIQAAAATDKAKKGQRSN
jgi:hypothetical protein